MRLNLRARLALSYLVVILVAMAGVIPLAWLAVERLYLSTQADNLLAQARLVASALQSTALEGTLQSSSPPTSGPSAYSQLSNALPGIHTRVIDPQGGAVIDLASGFGDPAAGSDPTAGLALPQLAQNAAGLVTPAELLARPEIVAALQGQPASAIRRVEAAGGKRVLYVAAPVLDGEGRPVQIVYLATPLPDTQWAALPAAVRWQLVGAILAAFLLAGAAGWLLARRLSRPLVRLAAAAGAVSAGDLAQTVPVDPAIDELAALGASFNAMTASLRQSDQAKTAFISDVSHELRTPLTVIKGSIETLQDGAMDDPKARDAFLASMDRETERLIRLVNDLLVLTRADAGALNLQLDSVDLGELARSRCAYLARAASQRQVSLCPPPETPPGCSVMADPDRIAQVLDNLLDNAIRYAPPGSTVTVTLARKGSEVACRVADAGPGIPAQHLPLIFERFYRADPARERSSGGKAGSGLGLAIVRGLVQAHGGRVAAESVEGKGTTITFWIPALQPPPF